MGEAGKQLLGPRNGFGEGRRGEGVNNESRVAGAGIDRGAPTANRSKERADRAGEATRFCPVGLGERPDQDCRAL